MGRAKPKAIKDKPTALAGSQLFQQAYYDLDSERAVGMSVGKIPYSAIRFYAHINEFSNAQIHALHIIVARMDAANLQYIANQHKK